MRSVHPAKVRAVMGAEIAEKEMFVTKRGLQITEREMFMTNMGLQLAKMDRHKGTNFYF